MKISSQVVLISPDLASTWLLEQHKHQRPLRALHVRQLADEMTSGRWSLNGEPIIFGNDGVLMDGQHRLQACVKAQVSFQALVVRGVDPDNYTTLDMGAARKASDLLSMDGLKSAGMCATIASIMWGIDGARDRGYFMDSRPRRQVLLAYVRENRTTVEEAATWMRRMKYLRLPFAAGVSGTFGWLYRDVVDAKRAELQVFINKIIEGEEIKQGDPEFALRRILLAGTHGLSMASGISGTGQNLIVAARVITAWTNRLRGRETNRSIALELHENKLPLFTKAWLDRCGLKKGG